MTITSNGKPFTPKEVLLSPQEVSEWTGISVGQLANLRYLGTGAKYRALTAKHIRYAESDVQDWIDASTRTGTSDVA